MGKVYITLIALQWSGSSFHLVERRNELLLVEEWFTDPKATSKLISISGMGGVGKSTLMSQLVSTAEQHGAKSLWIDGRACGHTPTGFIECLTATTAVLQEDYRLLFECDHQQRLLVCIDNFDAIESMEGWLLEVFMPRVSDTGVMLIAASRQGLPHRWLYHPRWANRIHRLQLAPFTCRESIQFLRGFPEINHSMYSQIFHDTKGHPLALAVTVEYTRLAIRGAGIEARVSQTVTAHLLRELTSPHLQDVLDALSVVGTGDLDLFSEALERTIRTADYHRLADLSFIHPTTNGIVLHDVARTHLLADLMHREPDRAYWLRSRLAHVLCTRLTRPDMTALHRRMTATQLINLCLAGVSRHSYADLSVNPDAYPITSYQPGDEKHLHRILYQWCSYSCDPARPDRMLTYHDFLDELCERFPEGLRIIRSDVGTPIAMLIILLVYDESSRFLSKYFEPELLECCSTEELSCSAEEAQTYYGVLVGFDAENGMYAGRELAGALTRESLSLLGERTRIALVAGNQALIKELTDLGFGSRPVSNSACNTYGQAYVLHLDLRNGGFVNWVNRFVHLTEPPNLTASPESVREALLVIAEPFRLGNTHLARQLKLDGRRVRAVLQSLLYDEQPSALLSPEQQQILRVTYEQCKGNSHSAAMQCHMSRATYYRHLKAALLRLSEVLPVFAVTGSAPPQFLKG